MNDLKITPIILIWLTMVSVCFSQNRGVGNQSISKLPAKEKRWALIIGVDNFGLRGAVNDAKALNKVLVKYAGFPQNQIVLLTTDDAVNSPSRQKILTELDELARSVPPDGLFLFAFSGHGKTIGDDAFLIPSDGKMTNNNRLLRDISVDVKSVKEAVKEMQVKQVLMLIDACRDRIEGRGSQAEPLTSAITRGFSFDEANQNVKAFVTLYATQLGDFAYEFLDKETDQYRGYFSRALEEGLAGKAANEKGEVTLANLVKYIEDTVPEKSYRSEGKRQVPRKDVSETYKENELILAVVKPAETRSPKSGEAAFWLTIEDSRDAAEFEDYLARVKRGEFPGAYRAAAEKKSSQLKKKSGERKNEESTAQKTPPNLDAADEFVSISGGTFSMSGNRREIKMPAFSIAKKKVTQTQWQALMKNNPSYLANCGQCPVESISLDKIKSFLGKLNAKGDGWIYRLPTEAEWEYAAKAGSVSDKIQNLDDGVWHIGNSQGKTHPVGEKKPNKWGLFDIYGNVMEWVAEDLNAPETDLSLGIVRGCSFLDAPAQCTPTRREVINDAQQNGIIGFRLARQRTAPFPVKRKPRGK